MGRYVTTKGKRTWERAGGEGRCSYCVNTCNDALKKKVVV